MRLFPILFLGLIACSGSLAAADEANEAFYVKPMELNIDPHAAERSAVLKVFNKESYDSRIRIDVFERFEGADGTERRALTKDVQVDATDFTVRAGDTQVVHVRYQGSRKLSREHAYRVVVKQVDSEASAKRSLDLRFVYEASVYVAPSNALPKLIVKDARRTANQAVEVNFQNDGLAHQKMDQLTAKIELTDSAGHREATLSEESRQLLSRQNFLSGSKRKLVLQIVGREVLTSHTLVTVKLVSNNITGR